MIRLETSRLILRQFLEEDAPFFFELNNDPEVIQYTGDAPFENVAASRSLIKNYTQYGKYNSGRLAVLLKENGSLLGWCGLKYHADTNETDLGYRFKKIYWNKGYATEASLACLAYAFQTLQLPYVTATAMKENAASIKVMEKLGMHFWKEVQEHDGPCVVYRIDNK